MKHVHSATSFRKGLLLYKNIVLRAPGSYAYTHTPRFNGPLPGTTRASRYQKGKTNLDFTEARDSRALVAVASAGPYASLPLAPDS